MLAGWLTGSRRSGLIGAVATLLIAPLALRLYYAGVLDAPWGPHIRNMTLTRLDAIAYGVIAAGLLYYQPTLWKKMATPAAWLGALFVVGSCLYVQSVDYTTDLLDRTFLFNAVSLGTMLCIPAIREIRRPVSAIAVPVTLISILSYSAYLCHMLILDSLEIVLEQIPSSAPLAGLALLIFFGATLVVSTFSYLMIEEPGLKLRSRLSRPEAHQV